MFTQLFKANFMKQNYFKNYLRAFTLLVVLLLGFSQVKAQSCNIAKNPNDNRSCLNSPASFTVSVTGGCTVVNVDWDFGDGSTQPGGTVTASHSYTTVNTTGYTVKATVHCQGGGTTVCTYLVRVYDPPVVTFKNTSVNPQCEPGNLFNIQDSSYSPSGAKLVFKRIEWGDGLNSQVSGNPATWSGPLTHSYSTYIPGDPDNGKPRCYAVVIEVRDEYGCVTRLAKPCYITVGGRLNISFTASYSIKCDSTPVTITNTSTDVMKAFTDRPGLFKQFIWNYGDGTSYTSPLWPSVSDPYWSIHTHLYKNKMGPFDISLTVIDSLGCVNTYLLKKGADNIYTKADFQVSHTGVYGDSDSMCYQGNSFNFKVPQPVHPVYVFKSSYNFGDPNSGPNNVYPQKADDPVVWTRDHVFSGCGVYLAKVVVTVYQPNGTTVICSKTDSAYVKVWGPTATIQSPAKGICVLNRYQCHIKDTVFFTNMSTYCQGDSALKKADGVTDSILAPNTVSHPTVLRLWDFDDLAKALPCTTYSDPITNPAKFGYRIKDTMNTNINCNYSMDSLPKHWYTPGNEKCYTVKLMLEDLKTGCKDEQQLTLALQPPKAKLTGSNSIDLAFEGQKCLSDGNDGRKVKLKWQASEPLCANQFVWLNFDSACGLNNFTPQTAFNPLIFTPPFPAYGCTYPGSPLAGTKANPFSQQGHSFPKQYTKQYTSTCDPTGKITIGLIVQNGCDSAVVTFQDSLWVYWTGCDWGNCTFSNAVQKASCKAAHPNSASYPAYARLNEASKITFFNAAQKAAALALMPTGQVVCYACRDTFWYHNAIEYKDLAATQDAGMVVKDKYCVGDSETYCPSKSASSQQFLLAITWSAYLYVPGKPNFRSVASDTAYMYTDTIYRLPTYHRNRWLIKQYVANGNYMSDTIGPNDVTSQYPRVVTIDSTYCYKLIGGVSTKLVQSIDTFTRDSVKCQKFKFNSNGKWVVNLNVTNTDTCDKANEGTRYPVIVGNKIDFNINDTTFCLGEAVKPKIDIRYWWSKPSPPSTQYDPYDYWNDKGRNPNSGGLSNKEVYWINWGDGGSFIKFDTAIRSIREHTYNAPGNYTIKVMWKDSSGCFDTLILRNLVHVVKPHAAFYIPQKSLACDQIVQFRDSSWIEQDTTLGAKYDHVLPSGVGYNWDFGDGSLASAIKDPTHLYAKNGDYVIKLRIFTEQGCQDSVEHKIHIEGPAPEFELAAGQKDTGCLPYNVNLFISNMSDTTYRYVNINWGDGTDTVLTKASRAAQFPLTPAGIISHTYKVPGRFCIKAIASDTVYDDLGNKLTCNRKFPCDTCEGICVVVYDFVLADFSMPDTVCLGEVVTFTATQDTIIYSEYNWKFGDGQTGTVNKPVYSTTHAYTAVGTYNVDFEPTYFLCAGTKRKPIVVVDTKADFGIDSTEKPKFIFTDKSIGTNYKTKYFWDFGDGATSNEKNPTHIYALLDTGCHTVRLVIDLACQDTIEKTVCNSYFFNKIIPNVFTVNNDGVNDVFDIDIEGESYYNLTIYNRWGQKMFHSEIDGDGKNPSDPNNWNGKVFNNGAEAPSGEYYFTFKYKVKSKPDEEVEEKGIITLIRK